MRRTGWRKKNTSEKDTALAEEYGVKMTYWRYKGRKGIYWSLLSEYVRRRDYMTYGTCISCGRKFTSWRESQAGHYAPAGNCGFALLFDKRNINGECAPCNNPVFSSGKLIPYRANLVKRYGEKAVKKLDEEYRVKKTMKEWTQGEYHEEILKLQEEIKKLGDDK
jgi:DNA-directed RNA polymerase subunit RPC12/RpoP